MVDSKEIDDVIASPDEDVSHFDDVGVDTPPRPDGLSDEEFYYYIVSICEDRIRHFGALAGDLLTDLRLRPGDDGPDDMFDQHMKEWQGWADTLARVELARSTMLLASMRWSEYQRTADGAETDDGELTMTSKTSTGAPVCASGACQVDTEHEAVLLASVAGNGTDISQQAQWRLRMEGREVLVYATPLCQQAQWRLLASGYDTLDLGIWRDGAFIQFDQPTRTRGDHGGPNASPRRVPWYERTKFFGKRGDQKPN